MNDFFRFFLVFRERRHMRERGFSTVIEEEREAVDLYWF
jgi:hypothetical protein